MKRLKKTSVATGNPVAKLQCQWKNNRTQRPGTARVMKSHFDTSIMVLQTDICVGSIVALYGMNLVPEVGLYNGAHGTVVDFIYDDVCGPNNKHGDHLPKCVIVDCPGLRLGQANPWEEYNESVTIILVCFLLRERLF